MRRAVALLLVFGFLCLGTGAAEFLHNASHAREDAAIAAAGIGSSDSHGQSQPSHLPIHDESNCRLHALLHAPLTSAAAAPALIARAMPIAVVHAVGRSCPSLTLHLRLDCRGPPAF